MLTRARTRVSPSMVVAGTALFFAVGGSAFAVGQKVAPQQRCATGAIKGIAFLTGDANKGLANLPTEYTRSPDVFGARFNCAGGAVEARRVGGPPGTFDVRFLRNNAGTAVVAILGGTPGAASVSRVGDAFRINIAGPAAGGAYHPRSDLPFVVIAM